MSVYPYLVAVWLLLIGLWGVIRSRNYIHLIICLTVLQASTYVLLLSVGYLNHGRAPIFTSDISSNARVVDPVVQALTLTDVVVEATVVALLLALVVQANKRYGTVDPDEIVRMRE
jgi:multicomponent Na+:H+ antiporter subunit C